MSKIYLINNLKRLFTLVLFSLLVSTGSYASHLMGGTITYRSLGGNQYEITVVYYRDCSGITADASVNVTIQNTCGLSNPTLNLPLIGGSGNDVTPDCPSNTTTCAAGTNFGLQQQIYRGNVTLSGACSEWKFSFSTSDRNTITNMNASPFGYYMEAVLNNSTGVNTSSNWTNILPTFACLNQPYTYNPGIYDTNGDSLVFELVSPMASATQANGYTAPFTYLNPLSSSTGFNFNSSTGQVSFTPTAVQTTNFAIKIYEYKNGILMGYTMRDVQLRVIDCGANNIPTVTGINGTSTYSMNTCAGSPVSFTVNATDSPSGTITLTNDVATAIPGASFTTSGTGPITGTFSWTPPAGTKGTFIFTLTVSDGVCPIPGRQIYTYAITIAAGVNAGPDMVYCTGGTPVQLNAVGGSGFSWSPSTGLSATNIANPTATPASTTTYTVTSSCGTDQVVVTVGAALASTLSPSAVTICQGSSTTLTAGPTTGSPAPTFTWTPATGLSSTSVSNPSASPTTTTTYSVTVSRGLGCSQTLTSTVTVLKAPTIMSVTAADSTLCLGTGTTLNIVAVNSPSSCAVPASACAGSTVYTIGSGTISTTTSSPYYGGWHDARNQYLYTKAELNAMGIIGGVIKSLAFNVATKSSTQPYSNFSIKIGCTGLTAVTATFQSGLTTVYSVANTTPAVGWNTYNFTGNGYEWDGVSNLLIEVCFDNTSYTSSDAIVYSTTSFLSTTYDYADNDAGCSLSSPYTTTIRPNIQLGVCVPTTGVTYTWTPNTNLTGASTVSPTVNSSIPAGSYTFNVNVGNGTCSSNGSVPVQVGSAFTLASSSNVTICNGSSTALTSTPSIAAAYTYTWTPTTGLSTSNTQNTTANPITTTTYTVTARNAGGCNQSKNITVTVLNAPYVNAYAPDSLLCQGEGTVLNSLAYMSASACGVPSAACTGSTTTYAIGSGTGSTASQTPYRGFYHDSRIQMLYTKAELNAMGVYGGVIKTVAFNISNKASTQAYSGFNIKIGCTSVTSMTSTFQTGLTTVYTAANQNTSAGINTYNLSGNGYEWDGTSNLLVEVCYDNNSYTDDDDVYFTTTAFTSVTHAYSDGTSGCTMTSASAYSTRPNIIFGFCAPTTGLTYTWSPATQLSSTTVAAPTVGTGLPLGTTTYTLSVSNGTCARTNSVPIKVGYPFALTISPSADICVGSGTQLSVIADTTVGTLSYAWTPTNNLTSSTISNPIANPPSATTYTVVVTSSEGCQGTASTNVTIKPGNIAVTASAASSVLCAGGSTNLTANATTSSLACGTSSCSGATTVYTKGASGTNGNNNASPFYSVSAKATSQVSIKRQYLYTKAELNAIGIPGGGVIKTIAFYADAAGVMPNFTMKIGCTSATTLTTTFVSGTIQVFNPTTLTLVAGWNTLTLNNPYNWDGTSNLVIEVCNDARAKAAGTTVHVETATSMASYNTQTGANNACSLTAATVISTRPIIRLGVCFIATSVSYAWAPATGLSSTTSATPIATPANSTTYTVTATDAGTGCADTKSVPIIINRVNAGPDQSICSGNNTTIAATFTGQTAPSSCQVATTPCGSTSSYSIGTATTTSGSVTPVYGYYTKQQMQILYTKADLNAAGITTAATINSLAFNVGTKASTKAYQGFTISIGCTSLNALSTFQSGLTTVYTNANFVPTTNSWNVFNFTGNGYVWDGTSNIIVNVCFDNGSSNYSSADPIEYTTTTGVNTVIYDYSDSGTETGCAMTTPTTSTLRPNIRFNACIFSSTPTYTWTSSPAAQIASGAATATITTNNLTSAVTYYVTGTTTTPACTLRDTVLVTIGTPTNLVWTGAVSTDWFVKGNWDLNCIPVCTTNVIIPNVANKPIINAAGAAARTVDIRSSSSLRIRKNYIMSVCGDWINAGDFIADTSTVVFMGTGIRQNYSNSGNCVFNNVTLNNDSCLYLNNDMELGGVGNFTFTAGRVVTSANKLIIDNAVPTSISGHNNARFVQGNLRRFVSGNSAYDFPVGLAPTTSLGYQLANVSFQSGLMGFTYLDARFVQYSAVPAVSLTDGTLLYSCPVPTNGKWIIDPDMTPTAGMRYNLKVYPNNFTSAGCVTTSTDWTIMKQPTGAAGAWALQGKIGSRFSGTLATNGSTAALRDSLTSFSEMAAVGAVVLLPIELLSFTGKLNGNDEYLQWVTLHEKDNYGFELERSTDAVNFKKIAFKSSKGYSKETHIYNYTDKSLLNGTYYYRLKIIANDNSFAYSNTISAKVTGNNSVYQVLAPFPNPNTGTSQIDFTLQEKGNVSVHVYNVIGQSVLTLPAKEYAPGNYSELINLSDLSQGTYIVKWNFNDKEEIFRIDLIK